LVCAITSVKRLYKPKTTAENPHRQTQVLRALGAANGEHVAIVMNNGRRFLDACFGMDRAGVYYTSVSTHLTAQQVAYIVADCRAKILVISDEVECETSELMPLLCEQVHKGNYWDT
jgi:long-chain acyl-CoA synthetase